MDGQLLADSVSYPWEKGLSLMNPSVVVALLVAVSAPLSGQTPPAAAPGLAAIVVPAKVSCVSGAAARAGDLGAVLAAGQAGLTTVVRTEQSRKVYMDVDLFERNFDKSGRKIIDQHVTSRTGVGARPIAALSAAALRATGYARMDPDGATFFAPDASILASDDFATGYCMRLREPTEQDSVPGGIGIAFEAPESDRTDIEGVLWLDRVSGELRRVDYHYNHMPADFKAPSAGGRIVFRTLPKGFAMAQQWSMRVPIVSVFEKKKGGVDRYSTNREDHAEKVVLYGTVTGFHEFGGVVKRAEVTGAPVWTP